MKRTIWSVLVGFNLAALPLHILNGSMGWVIWSIVAAAVSAVCAYGGGDE